MTLIHEIDAQIAAKHLLTHPFYEAWTAGTLPRAALLEYVGQYYAFESNLPRFLTALHSRAEDARVRASLLANAWDEEHGPNNHPELWLRFGEALGLERSAIVAATPNEATQALVAAYRRAANEGPVEGGIAALYAYESQLPAVAAAKIEGLKKHYGIVSKEGLAFFEVHKSLDVHHAAEERAIVEGAVAEARDAALDCAREALQAWWGFLSAIYEGACETAASAEGAYGTVSGATANLMSRTASLN
jgi:pyrroloquinoline-quinone synthase